MHLAGFTAATSLWHENNNSIVADEIDQIVLRMLPSTTSFLHTLEDLITNGWLYSSEVLFRSTLERLATISYLLTNRERGLLEWKSGWKMSSRPSLAKRLETLPTTSPSVMRIGVDPKNYQLAKEQLLALTPALNSAVHGDELSLLYTITHSKEGHDYYVYTNDLENPEYAKALALFAGFLVIFLTMVLDQHFTSYLGEITV